VFASRIEYVACLLFVASCGGAPPTEPLTVEAPPEPTEAREPSNARGVETHQRSFMSQCFDAQAEAKAFCECSWEVFSRLFTPEQMDQALVPERMAAFKEDVQRSCAALLPEPLVQSRFIQECSLDHEALRPFCTCGWRELRRTHSKDQLAVARADARKPRARAMINACEKKLPEPPVHDVFVEGCLRRDPAAGKFCECLWKQLRAAHSAAEVLTGLTDLSSLKPKIKAECNPLHPRHHKQGG